MNSSRRKKRPVGEVRRGDDPKVTVRIIGRCNFRCPSCSSFSGPERRGILSPADFSRILALLIRDGFRGVLNLSGGETTLHPRLPAFVRQASRRLPAARVVVFTNGDWVGRGGWRRLLGSLLAGPNVLVRFSLDRQHAEGKAMTLFGKANRSEVAALEKDRMEAARSFMAFCLERGAEPGRHFDFAFKGTAAAGSRYMSSLGRPPVYPIVFRRNPSRRPRAWGYLAVDLDAAGRPRVYATLSHIPRGEALGGIEALPAALAMNRRALRVSSAEEGR
jgi:uncharacterized Fe-S cluster-containing radical SAM superfamily protein